MVSTLEFVNSQAYFDALVLRYLSELMGTFGPNFPDFRSTQQDVQRKT
jgi:hypothetical protein